MAIEPLARISDRDTGGARTRAFLFDHIPKTGGTAFRAILAQIVGKENVSPWVSGRSELWAQQKYSSYPVISGHFHSPIPVIAPANQRARLTMLRDPVDRIVSEYYYYRNNVGTVQWNRLVGLAKEHSIGDYVRTLQGTRDTAICNFYARRFASQLSRQLGSDGKVLKLAKAALARYGFVGIQELFVDSVDLFCCRFGFPPMLEIPRLNITSSRKGVHDVDPETRARLEDLNRLDLELYEFARRRFEDEKRQIFHSFANQSDANESRPEESIRSETFETAASPAESFGDLSVEFWDALVRSSRSGTNILRSGEDVVLTLVVAAYEDVPDLTVGIEISDEVGEIVFGTNTFLMRETRSVLAGQTCRLEFAFSANMKHGKYFVGASLHTGATHEDRCFQWRDRIAQFTVVDDPASPFVGYCHVHPKLRWCGNA